MISEYSGISMYVRTPDVSSYSEHIIMRNIRIIARRRIFGGSFWNQLVLVRVGFGLYTTRIRVRQGDKKLKVWYFDRPWYRVYELVKGRTRRWHYSCCYTTILFCTTPYCSHESLQNGGACLLFDREKSLNFLLWSNRVYLSFECSCTGLNSEFD